MLMARESVNLFVMDGFYKLLDTELLFPTRWIFKM